MSLWSSLCRMTDHGRSRLSFFSSCCSMSMSGRVSVSVVLMLTLRRCRCYRLSGMPMHMLAVAFGPLTMAAACAGLQRLRESAADSVELRLDFFDEPFDLEVLLR